MARGARRRRQPRGQGALAASPKALPPLTCCSPAPARQRGWTAFFYAIMEGLPAQLVWLADHGADLQLKDRVRARRGALREAPS